MKASFVFSPRDVRAIEVPDPSIEKPDDVIIKVQACGVCPFDIRIYEGLFLPYTPCPIGHEISGTVVEVGEDVQSLKAGDKVAVDSIWRCNSCYYCRRGADNLCERRKGPLPNGFAEYFKMPEKHVHKLSDFVALDEAALCEPLACCINAIEKIYDIQLGDAVLVIGSGPIGLMFIQLLNNMGVRAIVSEPLEFRREKALELGAEEAIDPIKVDIVEKVKGLTDGKGANAVIMTFLSESAFHQALNSSAKRGTIVFFAAAYPPIKLSFDPNLIHYKEIALVGIEGRTADHFAQAVRLLSSGKMKLNGIISHRFPLNQIREAIETAKSRRGLKVIVKPWEE